MYQHSTPHTQVSSSHEEASEVGGSWLYHGTCHTGLGAAGQTSKEPAGRPHTQPFHSLLAALSWGWVKFPY